MIPLLPQNYNSTAPPHISSYYFPQQLALFPSGQASLPLAGSAAFLNSSLLLYSTPTQPACPAMGIQGLTKLLGDHAPKCIKEQQFNNYFGRKIAVDASMHIYQFLAVVGRQGDQLLSNEAGEVTSHLQGMFYRTARMLEAGRSHSSGAMHLGTEQLLPASQPRAMPYPRPFMHPLLLLLRHLLLFCAGIKPVYVFEGKPPELKIEQLKQRREKRDEADKELAAAKEAGDQQAIEKYSKRTTKVCDWLLACCSRQALHTGAARVACQQRIWGNGSCLQLLGVQERAGVQGSLPPAQARALPACR